MSAIVVNKKSNGKIRLCLDPQPLNRALKRCHYPIPTIEEVLPDLANAKVFTKLAGEAGPRLVYSNHLQYLFWSLQMDQDAFRDFFRRGNLSALTRSSH